MHIMFYFAKLKVAKLPICKSHTFLTLQHLFNIRNLLQLHCNIRSFLFESTLLPLQHECEEEHSRNSTK